MDTSTDTNGTIISWWWDFGDNIYSDLKDPTHCFYYDGTYNVTLTITDNYGVSNTSQKTIIVFTQPNQPPNVPTNPVPTNGETDVSIIVTLSWIGGDPDNDTVTYDVYFGTTSPPSKVLNNLSISSYEFGPLLYGMTYYWKVVAWDIHGLYTTGPIWHFTTRQNTQPNAPVINGPTSGNVGEIYNYTFIAIDPDDDNIHYEINWGDGTVDDWYGPVESNVIITRNHSWNEKGTYAIEARAKDVYGATGEWGSLSISMPLDLVLGNTLVLQQFNQSRIAFPVLRHLLVY
jgi:PKD repeat protein